MISRLYAVELRRLSYRRAGRVVAVVVLAVTVLTFLNIFRTSRDLTDAQLQQLRREAAIDVFGPGNIGGEPLPPSDFENYDFFDDPRFLFREEMPEVVFGMGALVAVAAFAFGATAGGADWSSGSVQALLFWEPRRVRVILTKVAAVATFALAAALVVQLLSIGLGSFTAALRGNFDGVDADFWQELAGRSLRVSMVSVFTALFAFGIAGFTRNTGAALGVAFVYFAILEGVIRGLRPRLTPYLVAENIDAWVRDGATLQFPIRRAPFFETFYNSGTRGATVLAVYLVVVVGVLTATFAKRDVT